MLQSFANINLYDSGLSVIAEDYRKLKQDERELKAPQNLLCVCVCVVLVGINALLFRFFTVLKYGCTTKLLKTTENSNKQIRRQKLKKQ